MSTTYKVVFTGKLKENVTKDQAMQGLISSFGLNEKQAGSLLNTKRPVVIKKGSTREQSKAFAIRLVKLGLNVKLLKEGEVTAKKPPVPPPEPAVEAETGTAKKPVAKAEQLQKKTAPPPPSTPEKKMEPVVVEQEKKGLPGKKSIEHYRNILTNALDTAKKYPKTWIDAIKNRKNLSAVPDETDSSS